MISVIFKKHVCWQQYHPSVYFMLTVLTQPVSSLWLFKAESLHKERENFLHNCIVIDFLYYFPFLVHPPILPFIPRWKLDLSFFFFFFLSYTPSLYLCTLRAFFLLCSIS